MPQWFKRQPNGALSKKALVGIGVIFGFIVLVSLFNSGNPDQPTTTINSQLQPAAISAQQDLGSVLGEEATQPVVTQPVINTTPAPVQQITPPAQPLEEPTYYENTYGDTVQSSTYYDSQPAGATAICGDGTYSFSQSRRGTCSHHGGVAECL